MTAIRKMFGAKVPFAAVIAFLAIAVLGFAAFTSFSKKELNYTLFMEDMSSAPVELDFGAMPSLGDFNFFSKMRENLLAEKADFVEANLSDMVLRVYIKGNMELEAPILTKGREGSWWETPAGIYKIETKNKSHFSSFGNVFQPWSMSFQGNFFIHGWPYYPDGAPVESTYSGGCIRLSDESAEKVFKLVSVGMPVIVFERDFEPDDFVYQSKPPELSAKSYLVADLMNNFVFLDKDRGERLPVASVTKLMTALVAGEFINLEKNIIIPKEAIMQTSRPRLKAGDSASAFDLLFPLLLESSNESAEVFASHLGRSRFLSLMNKKSAAIGMYSSRFADPSGISEENVSTCVDLFNLAKYLYNNRGFILNMSAGNAKNSAYGTPSFENLENLNPFKNDPSFIGGKIGKTAAAKETVLSVFELEFSGEKRPIAVIILGSENVYLDTMKVIDWLKNNY